MSKLRALLLLVIKLAFIMILLVYCTAWPGYHDFGSVENICVVTIILGTGLAFILEAVAIQTFRRKTMGSMFWLFVAHILTVILTIIESVCVFLYSQIASMNYERLVSALQWTSASDPSLMMTAEIFVKTISIMIVLLSLLTGLLLYECKRKPSSKADLDEICTSAYLETNPDVEQKSAGMHGTPYL